VLRDTHPTCEFEGGQDTICCKGLTWNYREEGRLGNLDLILDSYYGRNDTLWYCS
jgi:hypothetical protein